MQRILQLFSRALRLSLVEGLLCCTAATARAQGGGEPINLNATLTVTLTERPATAVLDEITRKTGIKFAYDPEDIRRLPAVSGEFKKVTVHELLDKCIAGSTFKYAIENNVVLVDKEKCIGCKYCMMACPYGVRSWSPSEHVVEDRKSVV